MKPKILVTRKISYQAEKKLKKNFSVTLNNNDVALNKKQLIKLCNNHDGAIVTAWDKLDKVFFNSLNGKLKILSTIAAGYDNIDIVSAKNQKIKVTNAPNLQNDAVAETTILLILASARRAYEGVSMIKNNRWSKTKIDHTKFMVGKSVTGKTLGIIGMGRIGRVVASRAKAFQMKILYHNRSRISSKDENGAKYFKSLDKMLPKCDFVSIHTDANNKSLNIINKKSISCLKKSSILINTSRGHTIDDNALIDALKKKRIFAAGLDVFKNEPNIDPRYLKLDNCFTLPHVASGNEESRVATSMIAVDNISNFFKKKILLSEVV